MWWTDPRLAYAAGLEDGIAMERAREGVVAEQVHREAVTRAIRTIDAADRRVRFDRGEVTA